MMKPQQDEKVLHLLTESLRAAEMRQGCTNHSYYAELVAEQLYDMGYYKGLPPSIEEALNSGDGVYRP
ncbi:MAG: hypothetical protein PHV11_10050 [Candidatus Bipolaricaulis sp.]|nr:hypothetical protein [Candidatus Bipolaricaulis sp.]